MSKIVLISRYRWFPVLMLALCVALSACRKPAEPVVEQTTMEVTPTTPPAQEFGPKMKVMVVEVILEADGTIRPIPKVKVKKNRDIAIWVTNGESMTITWKPNSPAPGNPFTNFECFGAFCGSVRPSDAPPNTYYYTVTVDGKTLDPDVEVEG